LFVCFHRKAHAIDLLAKRHKVTELLDRDKPPRGIVQEAMERFRAQRRAQQADDFDNVTPHDFIKHTLHISEDEMLAMWIDSAQQAAQQHQQQAQQPATSATTATAATSSSAAAATPQRLPRRIVKVPMGQVKRDGVDPKELLEELVDVQKQANIAHDAIQAGLRVLFKQVRWLCDCYLFLLICLFYFIFYLFYFYFYLFYFIIIIFF
jgi:hypothetical protein